MTAARPPGISVCGLWNSVRQEKKDNDKMMLAPLRAEERQRFFEILTKINNYYLHMEQELNKRNE